MNRRFLLTTALAGFASFPLSARAQTPEEARALVRRISDDMIALIRAPGGEAAKRAAFVRMMDNNADVRQISGFALGLYMRSMPEALKPRYIEAFKQFMAATYVGYFSDYEGETIDVGTARSVGRGFMVDTSVNRAGQPPLTIWWELSNRSGQLLVEDFVIEGVSMATSQRGEFAALIDSYGGNLEQFVQYLESRG